MSELTLRSFALSLQTHIINPKKTYAIKKKQRKAIAPIARLWYYHYRHATGRYRSQPIPAIQRNNHRRTYGHYSALLSAASRALSSN